MGKEKFVYTGIEVLEAMTEAVNYNNFLISLVLGEAKDTHTYKILDFGAGSGTYAGLIREKGIKVECLEPDTKLRNELKKANFKVYADSKSLKANSYDLIYALNVFEHIEDDFKEVAILKKALKKKGVLIIYVPAYQVLFSNLDKLVGHFRRYRLDRLEKMASSEGLKIKKLEYYDPIGFAAALVYRFTRGDGQLKGNSVKLYDRFAFPISKKLHPISKKLIGKNVILVAEK